MNIFGSILTAFKLALFLEAGVTVLKIGMSLKPNHHREIYLAQIPESLCSSFCCPYNETYSTHIGLHWDHVYRTLQKVNYHHGKFGETLT